MAVRFDAIADRLEMASGQFPSGTAYTWCTWFHFHTLRAANQAVWGVTASGPWCQLEISSAGALRLADSSSGAHISPTTLTAGNSYFLAVTHESAVATTLFVGTPGGALNVYPGNTFPSLTFARFIVNGDNFNQWTNARHAAFRLWSGVRLTTAQLQREFQQQTPAHTDNLHAFWPLLSDGDKLTDYSGNGRNLTTPAAGTWQTEEGPPVPWRATKPRMVFVPSAAGGAIVSPDRLDVPVTFHAPTLAPGAVTVAPSRMDVGVTFYEPTATGGAANVEPSRLDVGVTFYAPTIQPGAVTVAPARLDVPLQLYAPNILPGVATVSPARLDVAASFFAPSTSAGPVTLTPSRLDVPTTFYQPSLSGGVLPLGPDFYRRLWAARRM